MQETTYRFFNACYALNGTPRKCFDGEYSTDTIRGQALGALRWARCRQLQTQAHRKVYALCCRPSPLIHAPGHTRPHSAQHGIGHSSRARAQHKVV